MDTRPSAPTNLIPRVGAFQKKRTRTRATIREWNQITCQPSITRTRDPRCTSDIKCTTTTPAENNDAAVTRRRKPPQQTSADGKRTADPLTINDFPSSSRSKNEQGMNSIHQTNEWALPTSHQGDQLRGASATQNVVDDQTVGASYALHAIRAMCGSLRHSCSETPGFHPTGTARGHSACIAATGTTRNEEQNEPCRESSRGPVGAWQSLTGRNPGNTLGEAAERLQPPTERDPEGRQRGDVLRAMPTVWEPLAARPSDHFDAGFGDAAQQPHSVRLNRETTSRDPAALLPSRAREHGDAGHAAGESLLGMLDVKGDFRAQSGRVRRASGGPGQLRGSRLRASERARTAETRDQKVHVQMTYKTGQRLQGLSRDKGRKWENK